MEMDDPPVEEERALKERKDAEITAAEAMGKLDDEDEED